MNFIGTVLLFVGTACAVLVPIFFGHALSNEHGRHFFAYAGVAAVIAGVILWLHMKVVRTHDAGAHVEHH